MPMDVQIKNCNISPKFNESIYEYNVYCDNVSSLDIKYDQSLDIVVYGNNIHDGVNYVLLEYYDNVVNTYKFTVYNTAKKTFSLNNGGSKIEIKTYDYAISPSIIIGVISFCIIAIIYVLLFKKHK